MLFKISYEKQFASLLHETSTKQKCLTQSFQGVLGMWGVLEIMENIDNVENKRDLESVVYT